MRSSASGEMWGTSAAMPVPSRYGKLRSMSRHLIWDSSSGEGVPITSWILASCGCVEEQGRRLWEQSVGVCGGGKGQEGWIGRVGHGPGRASKTMSCQWEGREGEEKRE
eukprot:358087-Chlamydomonas_euryale.AAC.3